MVGWYCALAALLFLPVRVFGQSNNDLPWRANLTRQDVINALGDPEGDADLSGGIERMIYKDDLLITLTNNKVTDIEGPVPDALKPVAAAPAPTAAPATSTTPAPSSSSASPVAPPPAYAPGATTTLAPPPSSESTSQPVSQSPSPSSAPATAPSSAPQPALTTTPAPSPPSSPSSNDASDSSPPGEQDADKIIKDFSSTSIIPADSPYATALTKAFGPMENGSGGSGGAVGTGGLPASMASLMGGSSGPVSVWSNVDTWQGFLAGLLMKTVIMSLVLKVVFEYKEFPVLWREAIFVAAGVSLCNEVMAFLFSLNDFGKIASLVQADQIVAGAVLLALIMNFTGAKQFSTASGIMIAAMAVNIAVGYAQLFFL